MASISYGKPYDDYLRQQVETGDYASTAEVVREALRMHKHYRMTQAEEMENIRKAIGRGRKTPGKRPGKEVTAEIVERVKTRRGLK